MSGDHVWIRKSKLASLFHNVIRDKSLVSYHECCKTDRQKWLSFNAVSMTLTSTVCKVFITRLYESIRLGRFLIEYQTKLEKLKVSALVLDLAHHKPIHHDMESVFY